MNLCNWFAGLAGGYGTTPTCSMALITAPPSEADCISTFPDLRRPGLDVRGVRPHDRQRAQTTCTQASITMAESDPNCATVGQAGCFN